MLHTRLVHASCTLPALRLAFPTLRDKPTTQMTRSQRRRNRLAAPTQPPAQRAPIEFDQAINYVTTIKKRFERTPGTYSAFLEILHTYRKEHKSIKDVCEEVSCLFKDHTDLLAEFAIFLPDGARPPWVRPPPMVRWRRAVRLVGKLQMLHRRAAARAYAPGGGGFLAARDEFEELAGTPTRAEPAVDLDAELLGEELPEAAEAAEAAAEAGEAGETMASEDSERGASIASTIKGLPRRKLQDILLSLAEDPEEQERIERALQAAAQRPTTKGRGSGKQQKGKRRFHRAAGGGRSSGPPVTPTLSPTLAPASPPLMILRTPSVEARY